mgnify:CR=1 FL=1
MATKIRLKRIGRRNSPFYRMVAIDSRKRRDGAAIEQLGWYNPIDKNHSFELDQDRILHWLGEGAEPTDAAKKLLRNAGISHRWHLMKQGLSDSEIEKEMKKWELSREDVLKARSERAEKKAEEKVEVEQEKAQSDDLPESEVESAKGAEEKDQEEISNATNKESIDEDAAVEENVDNEDSSLEEE